ncbi:hypothetical protein [Peribacillus frigoritolerans]|uniref:hypothetical protein n=1 Tax=Peribacillus frigoritolerans TaxID=450367 RepID=UPI003B8D2744
MEGRAETVKAAVNELTDYLIGRNPNDIEDIWQTLYRGGFYRGGPILMSAISGIEQALWDIKGNTSIFLYTKCSAVKHGKKLKCTHGSEEIDRWM